MSRVTLGSFLSLPAISIVGALMFFTHAQANAENEESQPTQGQSQSQTWSQSQSSGDKNDSLKIINNPGGGQIVYGALAGQSTMQGAMVAMLRNIHGHFGEKPQVRNFFQAKGSNSVATFFSTNAKKQGGGTVPIYGMVIVSMTQGSKPIGAVLYDDSAHFAKSQPIMMKALNEAWNTAVTQHGSGNGGSPSQQSAPVTLRQATGGTAVQASVFRQDGRSPMWLEVICRSPARTAK
jgi:hypothetical protein